MMEHKDHIWVEVSPCIYCDDCNVRLYQGTLPDNQEEMCLFLDSLEVRGQQLLKEEGGASPS